MREDIFNGAFWIAIVASIGGILGLVFTAINKSKCQTVECCCFKCVRDIQSEIELEEHRMDLGIPETPVKLNEIKIS